MMKGLLNIVDALPPGPVEVIGQYVPVIIGALIICAVVAVVIIRRRKK